VIGPKLVQARYSSDSCVGFSFTCKLQRSRDWNSQIQSGTQTEIGGASNCEIA
jgi:hypothetical protein